MLTWITLLEKHVSGYIWCAGRYSTTRLCRIYVSVIRPVLEYTCPVWHTGLPDYLTQSIGVVQKRALECVYPAQSYSAILHQTKLPTLHERRDELCRSYLTRMKREGHKLNHLLPVARDNRTRLGMIARIHPQKP